MNYACFVIPIALDVVRKDLFIVCLIFLAVLILLLFVMLRVQRRWDPRRQGPDEQGGKLTIEQIDAMHQGGFISDEEFAAMRRVVMGLNLSAESPEKDSESSCPDGRIDDSKRGCPRPGSGPDARKDNE